MDASLTEFVDSEINGYPIRLPRWRHQFYVDRAEQGWEKVRIDSCHDLLKRGMTVYDIGAECGDFTALYRGWIDTGSVGEVFAPIQGQVLPIEPSPPAWPLIRQIWEANGYPPPQWTFTGFAGEEIMHFPPNSDFSYPLNGGWPACAAGDGIPEYGFRHLAQQQDTTPTTTIDHLARAAPPDAIVIDVEGAEWNVLRGAHAVMRSIRPIIWVSVHPPTMLDWYGKHPSDIRTLCAELDYDVEILGEEVEEFWLLTPMGGPGQ